jgi:hypothetical protein
MKRIALIAVFLMTSIGIMACAEIVVPEEVDSIELNFVPQEVYELGDDVSLAGKTITVNFVDELDDSIILDITDDDVAISGDGITSEMKLYTAVVGLYTVSFTYEDNMVEFQYIVDDPVLLGEINDPENYSGTKLNASFWTSNYGSLASWGLLFYWDKIGTVNSDPGFATTPVTITIGGTAVTNPVYTLASTIENTTGAYVASKVGDTFELGEEPWESGYEFQTYIKDTVAYRYQNKNANLATANFEFLNQDEYDLDLLILDVYKAIKNLKLKSVIDDKPVSYWIEEMELLIYGGDVNIEIGNEQVIVNDMVGLNEFSSVQLTEFNTLLDIYINGYFANGVTAANCRSSYKLEKVSSTTQKINGLYGNIWKAVLEVNNIDTSTYMLLNYDHS